jgi:HAD superfamily hydrolase (TIGR01509 family)
MNQQLIIWDCDGVLVDSEWIGARAFTEIIQDLGGVLSVEEVYHALKGGSIYDSIRYVHQNVSVPEDADIEKMYRRRSAELFEKELKQVDGVESVLLQTGHYRCVASNGPRIKIFENLRITGLKSYFPDESIFSGHDIKKFKPEPDLFLLACHTMGATPDRCIVIEDSVHGAEAARAAGMKCYGYSAETPSELFTAKGATPFRKMQDLLQYLS